MLKRTLVFLLILMISLAACQNEDGEDDGEDFVVPQQPALVIRSDTASQAGSLSSSCWPAGLGNTQCTLSFPDMASVDGLSVDSMGTVALDISGGQSPDEVVLRVLDESGATVQEETFAAGEPIEFSLNNVSTGRYQVEVDAYFYGLAETDAVLNSLFALDVGGVAVASDPTDTPEPSENTTQAPTEMMTEAPSQSVTEMATEVATEMMPAATESATEVPTMTEAAPTVLVTEAVTAVMTEMPTDIATEAVTTAPTEMMTETVVEAATAMATEAMTEAATMDMVEIEAMTEVATEDTPDKATSTATASPTNTLASDDPAVAATEDTTPDLQVPTFTPSATATLLPSDTLAPTETTAASNTPTTAPSDTLAPTQTAAPTNTPTATATLLPSDTPIPTVDPNLPTATITPFADGSSNELPTESATEPSLEDVEDMLPMLVVLVGGQEFGPVGVTFCTDPEDEDTCETFVARDADELSPLTVGSNNSIALQLDSESPLSLSYNLISRNTFESAFSDTIENRRLVVFSMNASSGLYLLRVEVIWETMRAEYAFELEVTD